MSYGLIVRPLAERDIQEAFDWYEEEAAGLGSEFLVDARASIHKVIDSPLSYQIVIGTTRRVLLNRFPYSLFFVVLEDSVIVTACIHQRRSPKVWMSRK